VAGKYGNALDFDGVDDYVSIPESNSLKPGKAVTVSAWVYLKGSPTDYEVYVVKGDGGTWNYLLEAGLVANTVHFRISTTIDSNAYTPNYPLSLNQWYYLTGVYDGSNLKLYVNGVLIYSPALTGDIITTSSRTVDIGHWTGGGANYYTNGLIDDVRIYNYALTRQQILMDYNQGSAVRFGPITGTP